ncbi:oleate hydratase [Bradyrhizobium sp. BRP22]|nr:oleate hydratase [Bradyrhizobium sp. BRP22]
MRGTPSSRAAGACSGREIVSNFAHTRQLVRRYGNDAPHGDGPAEDLSTGSRKLAFIGQFCEFPEDVVFTVECSVRVAQTALFGLLDVQRPVSPFSMGQHDPASSSTPGTRGTADEHETRIIS